MTQIVIIPPLCCGEEGGAVDDVGAGSGAEVTGDEAGDAGWGVGAVSVDGLATAIGGFTARGWTGGCEAATAGMLCLASITKADVGTQNDPIGPPPPR